MVLTVASLPILIPSFVLGLLYSLRRRGGYAPNKPLMFFAQAITTMIIYGACSGLGKSIGVAGVFVGVPLTLLIWAPLLARYALPKLVK